jgi:hemerythrin
MAYTWDTSLETGNEAIDTQHKALIKAINNLLEACSQGQGRNKIEETLVFLNNYIAIHFRDEEQLQMKSNYPDYANHKKFHEEFKQTVQQIIQEYKSSGATFDLLSKVNSSIAFWLINHIKVEDKKVAAHIKSVGA